MSARFLRWCVIGGLLLASCIGSDAPQATAQPRPPQKYALLVGVTEYSNLERQWWLEGPANDVALMAAVLTDAPFSIPERNITRLAGWPRIPSERPTRANIEAQFRRLANTVIENDQVVILMAGHGSQQPANADPADEEDDALDETFLPADVGRWDGTARTVTNAIVDDDIRGWVTAIRDKGAVVWLIFDSCHSGTMARGGNAERDRQIPSSVLIPESALARSPARSRGGQGTGPMLGLPENAGDLVAVYASQMSEPTPEMRLPTRTSPYHGLFTYTIASVLKDSRSALTYRELIDRVFENYRSVGRFGPTPMFEGGAVDREILGLRSWPDRPALLLGSRRDNSGWQLGGGAIHGLTRDTIVELFPPAGAASPDTSIGYVRVVSTEALESVVEPVAYRQTAAPTPAVMVTGSRGRVAAVAVAVDQLLIAVQVETGRRDVLGAPVYEVAPPGRGPAALERALESLSERTAQLARRTATDVDADWVIRSVDGRVVLVPSGGWYGQAPDGTPRSAPAAFTLGTDGDPALPEAVASAARRIARATNLLKLAGSQTRDMSDIDVTIELMRYEGGEAVPVPLQSGGRVLRAGDVVAFRITNESDSSVDVTLLLLESGYGIVPRFPPRDSASAGRFGPRQTRLTGRFNVTADRPEIEQVVAIAVTRSDPPVNFSVLAQDSLTPADGEAFRGGGVPGSADALQTLLKNAVFGDGTQARTLIPADIKGHAMRLIAWRTEPVAP